MENGEWISGKVTLKMFGEPVEMEMTVPAKPVKMSRMLPIFQAMTSSFAGVGEAAAAARGEEISCKKGCGACCRQAVPLMEIEVYQIRDLVENMPEPRRSEIKRRFAEAFNYFVENGWFEKMSHFNEMTIQEGLKTVMEYFYEGVPCPFLEDESCSIHLERPLICREYLVTSPAENCANPTPATIERAELPIKISPVILRFNRFGRFVPLIAALEFAEQFSEDETEKNGMEWMQEFFARLIEQKQAKQ
ncbi:MAG: YkgJ family cysteine cluster protein [Acidobacteriota bacterium]|nr:YkgJ family cysteine cluster protein [Acidobacteriota bacterium]